jgi:hypothetical protein
MVKCHLIRSLFNFARVCVYARARMYITYYPLWFQQINSASSASTSIYIYIHLCECEHELVVLWFVSCLLSPRSFYWCRVSIHHSALGMWMWDWYRIRNPDETGGHISPFYSRYGSTIIPVSFLFLFLGIKNEYKVSFFCLEFEYWILSFVTIRPRLICRLRKRKSETTLWTVKLKLKSRKIVKVSMEIC